MSEVHIKHMVNRFLGWKLPKDFNPDAGISYTRPNYHESWDATPSGTNLFDAAQAEAMVRHMLEGLEIDSDTAQKIDEIHAAICTPKTRAPSMPDAIEQIINDGDPEKIWSPYELAPVLAKQGIIAKENVISSALCRLRDQRRVRRLRTNLYQAIPKPSFKDVGRDKI